MRMQIMNANGNDNYLVCESKRLQIMSMNAHASDEW